LGPRGAIGRNGAAAAAVVVIVNTVLVAGGTTGFGLNIATAPGGKPDAVKVTGPGKEPVMIVNIAVWPGGTDSEPVGTDNVKSVIVTLTGPAAEARKVEFPANEAEIVVDPAV
jgi:hypothetical protein